MIAIRSLMYGEHHDPETGDSTKARLCVRAARHGRSMEEEARAILKAGPAPEPARRPNLAESDEQAPGTES